MAIIDRYHADVDKLNHGNHPHHHITAHNYTAESMMSAPATAPSSSAPSKTFIVTAHTHDDQLETLLMKLVRGVHIANFEPMQTLHDEVFYKPLLQLTKKQLIDYLQARRLQWREDMSNQQSDRYKRNKVRLMLVPLMAEIAGTIDTIIR